MHLGWRNRIRLGRDYYVRLDTNDYSVDPAPIGQVIDVTADLDRVRVRAGGRFVADHPRVWARGTTLTDPAHVQTAASLRRQFQQSQPSQQSQQPRAITGSGSGGDGLARDLARDLADYDRAFGLIDGAADEEVS